MAGGQSLFRTLSTCRHGHTIAMLYMSKSTHHACENILSTEAHVGDRKLPAISLAFSRRLRLHRRVPATQSRGIFACTPSSVARIIDRRQTWAVIYIYIYIYIHICIYIYIYILLALLLLSSYYITLYGLDNTYIYIYIYIHIHTWIHTHIFHSLAVLVEVQALAPVALARLGNGP